MLKLVIAEDKSVRLNPYKRITKGTTKNITVDGVAVEAITDTAEKYTYLNVGGVDYYVTANLADGGAYTTINWEPKAKPVKTEGDDAEAKPKKTRKPKAEEAAAA